MKKQTFLIFIFSLSLFYFGCNQQSTALNYDGSIISEDVDGNSRDMLIKGDTLIVVSEDEGLLLYKINENFGENSMVLDSIWADSASFHFYDWHPVQIQYSNLLDQILILDKFYSIQYSDLPDLIDEGFNAFDIVCCSLDNQHPSTFTVNSLDEKLEIFSLVRNVSDQEGVPNDIVSIYQINLLEIADDFIIADAPIEIIDSLIYDATDIHYMNNSLFISHTNYEQNEFRAYKRNDIGNPFELDTAMTTPFIAESLYSNEEFLFVGMGEHWGVKIYNIDSMEEVSWTAEGFTVRDIYWDPLSNKLLISCGYQGVIVLKLADNMTVENSWVLTSSFAYAARAYNEHVLVSTRNGIEIFKIQ